MRKGIGPQMNADKRRCFGRMSAFLCLLTPIAVLAWNGTSRIRFGEIAAKAKAQPTHHTRRFGGKNGDVLRMFTSGGAAVAVGDYDNDGFDDMFVTDSDNGRKSHLCVKKDSGNVCTKTCNAATDCPTDWTCGDEQTPTGENVTVCLPPGTGL